MIVRRIFAATTALVSVAGIVTACSSVPDISFGTGDEDDAGALLPDGAPNPKFDSGNPTDGNVADTGKDAPADVKTDTPPICTPTNGGVEDCDDGLDNDCNGKFDCEDDACKPNFECIPTPPVGWQLVRESDTARDPCPTDYPTARDIELVQGNGVGMCTCACSLTVPSEACNLQTSSVLISPNATCAAPDNAAQTPQAIAAAATNCTALTTPIDITNTGNPGGKVTGPTAPPSGCTGNVTPTSIPPITQGRTCAPAATPVFGTGCGIGQVCAKKAPGLNACIQKAGSDTCPVAGYTAPRSAGGATLADGGAVDGGATVDNRTCRSCNCSSPTCGAPTATLYQAGDCSGVNTSGTLTTTCAATAKKNFTATAYKSTIGAGGGCTPTGFVNTTQNSISFTDPTTICCKP